MTAHSGVLNSVLPRQFRFWLLPPLFLPFRAEHYCGCPQVLFVTSRCQMLICCPQTLSDAINGKSGQVVKPRAIPIADFTFEVRVWAFARDRAINYYIEAVCLSLLFFVT